MSRPNSLILTAMVAVVFSLSALQVVAQSLSVSATASNYNGYSVSCNGSEDGSIDLTVSGGTAPYSFAWNTINGSAASDGAVTEDLTNLKAGTYTIIVNDSVGAGDTLNIVLNQPSSLSASLFSQSFNGYNIHCNGGADGQITTTVNGGVAPFQYLWNTGDTVPNIGSLAAGNYQLIVTGANGCKDTSVITLSQPSGLALQLYSSNTATGYGLHCAGDNSGEINLSVSGGVSTYIYNWSNGAITEDLLLIGAGVYSVRVEDVNGCVKIDSTILTEPTPLSFTGSATEYATGQYFSCDTCNDGAYSLTVFGGSGPVTMHTYQWSNGQNSYMASSLSPDTYYSFTITDVEGCTITDSILLPANVPLIPIELFGTLSSYAGGHQVSTFGGNNGWIDLQVIGGIPPFTYQWTGPPTFPAALGVFQDLNGLRAGTYTVTVTGAAGQQAQKSFTLNGPANPLSVTLALQNPNCSGVSSGQLSTAVSGATPPYTYLWSTVNGSAQINGATSSSISQLAAGVYSVKIKDANNDSLIVSDTIVSPIEILSSIVPSVNEQGYHLVCAEESSVVLDLSVSGGTAPYTYLWDNGKFTQDITVSLPGTYMVQVKDGLNCIRYDSLVVVAPEEVNIDAQWHTYPNGKLFSCDTCNDAQATVTFTGGVPPYVMSLSSASQSLIGPSFTGLYADTSYTLHFEDAIGCVMEMTGTEALIIPRGGFNSLGASAQLSQYPGGYNISTSGGNDGWISLNTHGEMSQTTIVWADGATGDYRDGLTAGTYEVTVSDNAGQSITKTYTLTQPANGMSASIGNQTSGCGTSVYLEAYVNGGVPPYTYQWTNPIGESIGQGYSYVSGSGASFGEGPYFVRVVDANNDTTETSYNVTFANFSVNLTASLVGGYNVSCSDNDGVVSVEIHGGDAPYYVKVNGPKGHHYEFPTSDTLVQVDSLKSGTYWIEVSGMNGCQTNGEITLTPGQFGIMNADWFTYPNGKLFSCDTCNDAQVTVFVQGGVPPYIISMESQTMNLVGPAFTGIYADTAYILRAIDARGCEFVMDGEDALIIPRGGFNSLGISAQVSQYPGGYNISMNGGSDGWIHINVYGQESQPTIVWNDGTSEEYHSNLSAGYHEVTVTDNAGQSVTKGWTLTEPSNELIASVSNSSGPCNNYSNFNAYVNGGVPPYSYQWYGPGGPIGGGWSYYSTNQEGEYSVLVIDANNDSTQGYISFYPREFSMVATPLSVAEGVHVNCNQTNGVVEIIVFQGNGPFSYRLTEDYVDVTTRLDTTVITSDTALLLGGLRAGRYTVYLSEMNAPNCGAKQQVTLVGSEIDVEMTPHVYPNTQFFSCDTCNDGALTIDSIWGGTPPYQFVWSTGETSGVLSGMYSDSIYGITITDANGCIMTDEGSLPRGDLSVIFNLEVSATLSQYPGGYNVGCFGCNNGSIELHINGGIPPYEIVWNTSDSLPFLQNLMAGTYSVHVSDQNGNVFEKTYTLLQPQSGPSVMLTGTYSNCQGGGNINAMVNGGTPPYSYRWYGPYGQMPDQWNNIWVNQQGDYTLWVKDANNDSTEANIPMYPAPSLWVEVNSPTLYGTANAGCSVPDGSIIVQLHGGQPPYQVSLKDLSYGYKDNPPMGPATNATTATGSGNYFTTNDSILVIDSLKAGQYHVYVNDMSNCGGQGRDIQLNSPPPISVKVVPTTQPNGYYMSCDTCHDGTAVLQVTGAYGSLQYAWAQVPEEYADRRLEGASMFERIDGDDVDATELFSGNVPFVIGSSAQQTGFSPEVMYAGFAMDELGCMGGEGFFLEKPKDNGGGSDPDWKLNGNSGLDPMGLQRWLGTNDSTDFVMKANNQPQLRLGADGIMEVTQRLRLSGLPTIQVDTTWQTNKILVLRSDGTVAAAPPSPAMTNWGEPEWEDNVLTPPCMQAAAGGFVEYWKYQPDKIFVQCPMVNVGIGTNTPLVKLDVRGQTYSQTLSVNTYAQDAKVTIKGGQPGTQNQFKALEVQDTDGNAALRVFNDSRVVIGKGDITSQTLTTQEHLRIQGTSISNPILFLAASDWSSLANSAKIVLGHESEFISSQYGRGIQIESFNKINFWTPRIGINVEQPESSLDIDASAANAYSGIKIRLGDHNWRKGIQIDCSADNAVPILVMDPENGVAKFEVRGSGMVYARGVWVKLGDFPDYVFHDDYELMPLNELKQFVEKHSHLPEIPSAKDVEDKGLDLGEMNKLLLKKVEELTLYLIAQEKRITDLENGNTK